MKKSKLHNYLRIMVLATTFVFTSGLWGCGLLSKVDEGLKDNKRKSDDKYWTERNIPPVDLDIEVECAGEEANFNADMRISRCIYKYLEDGDKEKLKSTFARSVIDSYDKLEDDLEALIEFYSRLTVEKYVIDENSLYKAYKLEEKDNLAEYVYHTKFDYMDERYVLDIMFVRDSKQDKDVLGVHGIRLRNRDTNEAVIVNTIDWDIK